MDSVFEGQVGILRLSQPQCDLGVPLNKLNVYVCVGYVPVRVHRLLRMREEMAWESTEAFRAPGREERQSGGKTTPSQVGTLLWM